MFFELSIFKSRIMCHFLKFLLDIFDLLSLRNIIIFLVLFSVSFRILTFFSPLLYFFPPYFTTFFTSSFSSIFGKWKEGRDVDDWHPGIKLLVFSSVLLVFLIFRPDPDPGSSFLDSGSNFNLTIKMVLFKNLYFALPGSGSRQYNVSPSTSFILTLFKIDGLFALIVI